MGNAVRIKIVQKVLPNQSLNYQLRKVTKNRSIFVNDDSILKLMYLALRNASEKWTMPIKNWRQALNQFAIEFGKERVPF